MSAIEDTSVDTLAVPDTGTVRDDLVHLLRSLADVLAGPGGDANRALLGVLPNEPALAEAYRRGPLVVWEQAFLAIFRRLPTAGSSLQARGAPWLLRRVRRSSSSGDSSGTLASTTTSSMLLWTS